MRKGNTEGFLIAFPRLLFLLGLQACVSGSRLSACLVCFLRSVAAKVGCGFAQWVTEKDSVSQQGSSRWREQVVPQCTAAASPASPSLCCSSLSRSSVLGTVAQHHCAVPKVATLLCVLRGVISLLCVIYLGWRSSLTAVCVCLWRMKSCPRWINCEIT